MVISVPKDYEEAVAPISDFSPFTETKNSLHDANTSLIDEMEIQEASSSALSTVRNDLKLAQKKQKI